MIKFDNVGKTYVSKSKSKVEALKNVSFELGSNGMTFILGKSGSGKSTLLNLLGGLDQPTVGHIEIDGVSMQSFTRADYESYRNSYVGFVFQEYNLLDEFNVKENISLALQLSKDTDVDKKVVEALKQVELNEEYLTRRVGELSGGEKQRVAIARAIVKDSRMILADEPTGNLDSETGESIWKILQSLSRDRLVVVVSHDRESAEKYADRTIEIADGKVIADNGAQQITDSEIKPRVNKQSRLPFALRLKMGYNNLKLRKGKTVSVLLVAIFSILSIILTQLCLSYSPEAAMAKYMIKNGVDYFVVGQGFNRENDNSFNPNNGKPFYPSTQKYVADNANYIRNGVIECKQDILDMGLTFVGEALEIDDNSYYLTTTQVDQYCYTRGQVKVDGEYIDIVKELHPIEYLVGKEVRYWSLTSEDDWVLAGVVDFENLTNPPFFSDKVFHTKGFKGIYVNSQQTYNYNSYDIIMQVDDKQYIDAFHLTTFGDSRFSTAYGSAALTADGILDSESDGEFADNEIVMTYELFAKIFDAKSKGYYLTSDLKEVRNMPPELGQTFSLKFKACDNDEILLDCGEVKLAGIYFDRSEPMVKNRIWMGDGMFKQIVTELDKSFVLIQTSSVKNLKSFLTTFRRNHLGVITNAGYVETTSPMPNVDKYNSVSEECYALEQTIITVSVLFAAIGLILIVVLLLMVINLISFSIAGRKKEIGILSAIGASNRDITSIFLLEATIIAAICFVIILVLSFVSTFTLNILLSRFQLFSITIPFLQVGIMTIVILLASSFGLMLIAALIPTCKIIKLKPIDAIRAL